MTLMTVAVLNFYPLSQVDSSTLIPLNGLEKREDFARAFARKQWELESLFLARSPFVSKAFAEHLIRDKKDSALGVKYIPGDTITQMEGALHTFLTPICPITLSGDLFYAGKHSLFPFINAGRRVILSAAIQPDFELPGDQEVMMKIVEIREQALEGAPLGADVKPLCKQFPNQNEFRQHLPCYEKALQRHMIYHLTEGHRLPALSEIKGHVLTTQIAKKILETLIMQKEISVNRLQGQFVDLNGHVISLEVLFNTYFHQLTNEFSVFEKELTQGYVYTIDPHPILAQQIGKATGVKLLNRIQVLAFKYLNLRMPLKKLHFVGFNSHLDPKCLALFQAALPTAFIMNQSDLFREGYYSVKLSCALILHNNSNAFGQNIETEEPTSLNGIIGTYSDASTQLSRFRYDLFDHLR